MLATGLTPKEASRLRILDPACGSGSFLLGAYQFLLDWHRDWYVADGAEKHARGRAPELYRDPSGGWRLTTAEKKRILLNNIYGVDIDPQAVEVTKLSLLLKILEGESAETLANQLRLYHERALPDLGGNIKCGNSLIGPDYYDDRGKDLPDDEERRRINAFDWNAEFPAAFKAGGFDAVIGNPPWLMAGYYINDGMDYLRCHYTCVQGKFDLYYLFMSSGIRRLNPAGCFGMIIRTNSSTPVPRGGYGGSFPRRGSSMRWLILVTRNCLQGQRTTPVSCCFSAPAAASFVSAVLAWG